MAQFLLLRLILAGVFVALAMAGENAQSTIQPNAAPSSNPSAPSPINTGGTLYRAEEPAIRKLGKHQPEVKESYSAPDLSPTEAPEKMFSRKDTSSSIEIAPIEPNDEEKGSNRWQGILLRKHHHSIDKSIAGGGVILGGLATTFSVAVFCYIRATGRHKAETVP
ncbi:hypothetical protein CJ030_MR2G013758 [Morella rubra]|uniref:Uncharacterized protein n=1 Tax=Morella rubra TaxID=262757 RepID=A0A6A1WIF1_9ROSI|nr:hypothetical protein CJ030_MR2G013758 [Morella rubra]